MRVYKVFTVYSEFKIIADELEFQRNFHHETEKESLVFFDGKRVVAIFKTWNAVVDVGEHVPSQHVSVEQLTQFN